MNNYKQKKLTMKRINNLNTNLISNWYISYRIGVNLTDYILDI